MQEIGGQSTKLKVCFENKETTKNISFDYKKKIGSNKELQKYRDTLIRKCPCLPYSDDVETTLQKIDRKTVPMRITIPGFGLFSLEKERTRYNKERTEYIEKIDPHIKEIQEYDKIHSRSFEFKLLIDNNGTCPASSVSVKLRFPDGFKLIDLDCSEIDEIEHLPKPPVIPEQPSSIFESPTNKSSPPFIPRKNLQLQEQNNIRPLIKKVTDGYIFTYSIKEIIHFKDSSMGRFKIFFDSCDKIKKFNVDCELQCKELLKPEQHTIHFIANK